MPSKVTLEVTLNTRAEAKEDILPPSQPSHLSRGRGIGSTPIPYSGLQSITTGAPTQFR